MQRLWQFLYPIFPLPLMIWAERQLATPTAEQLTRRERWLALGRDELLKQLDLEWERAKFLDDKLFKLTTALSVAVTAGGALAKTLMASVAGWALSGWVFALLLYAIILLFTGAIMGFSGLRPKARPGYGVDFALRIQRPSRPAKLEIADALLSYELTNMLRANEASAANVAIRNGVLAFATALLIALFAPPKVAARGPESDVSIVLSQPRSVQAVDGKPAVDQP